MGHRLIFMGTPAFAVPALEALVCAGHQVVAVYSQPPRPAGRGERIQKSPVHAWADSKGLRVLTPSTLNTLEAKQIFYDHRSTMAVVVAYGLLLPREILKVPQKGCMNIHGSLLPRWRGASPIQRAIEAGDPHSGITFMHMDEGMDTGPILAQYSFPLEVQETAQTLHDRLSNLGASKVTEVLEAFINGEIMAVPQPTFGVTHAPKLQRHESQVRWEEDAQVIERKIRAFTPWPGMFFYLKGKRVKLLKAEVVSFHGTSHETPGTVVDSPLVVACGQGALKITHLQREGKQAMNAQDFLRGSPLCLGTLLQDT